MLLGAQSAWATDIIKGSWDGWATTHDLQTDQETHIGSVQIELAANQSYEFGVDNGSFFGNTGIIWCDQSNWTFETGMGNCTLKTGLAGIYTFTVYWDPSDSQKPHVTVTYPKTNYTIYFSNTASWSNVYAYVWRGEAKPLGGWPGTKATEIETGLYAISFESWVTPEYVKWNDGGSNEGSNIAFENNAVFTNTANTGNHKYKISPTNVEGNYYATFYASEKVAFPSGVTAYNGELSGSTLVLSAYNSQIIPANTAVVLGATSSSTFYASPTSDAAGSASGNNSLAGNIDATKVSSISVGTGTLCVLGVNNTNVGFYKFTGNMLAPNRAYLIVPGSGTAPSIHFAIDDATDIKSVEASEKAVKFIQDGKLFIKKNGVVYDMMGAVVK